MQERKVTYISNLEESEEEEHRKPERSNDIGEISQKSIEDEEELQDEDELKRIKLKQLERWN